MIPKISFKVKLCAVASQSSHHSISLCGITVMLENMNIYLSLKSLYNERYCE